MTRVIVFVLSHRARVTRYAALRDAAPSQAPAERALELGLGHPRPAADVPVLRLLVELVPRASARPFAPTAKTTPAPGGDVFAGQPGRLPRLSASCSLLVDRASGDLLRLALR